MAGRTLNKECRPLDCASSSSVVIKEHGIRHQTMPLARMSGRRSSTATSKERSEMYASLADALIETSRAITKLCEDYKPTSRESEYLLDELFGYSASFKKKAVLCYKRAIVEQKKADRKRKARLLTQADTCLRSADKTIERHMRLHGRQSTPIYINFNGERMRGKLN